MSTAPEQGQSHRNKVRRGVGKRHENEHRARFDTHIVRKKQPGILNTMIQYLRRGLWAYIRKYDPGTKNQEPRLHIRKFTFIGLYIYYIIYVYMVTDRIIDEI